MEEKRPQDKTASSAQGWSGIFWLSVFLLLEGVALYSVTMWQQNTLARYSARIYIKDHLLARLEETCAPLEDVDGPTFPNRGQRGEAEPEAVSRNKRQTLSGLFHDLLLAQKDVLMEVCTRRYDLCQPGPKGEKGDRGERGINGTAGPKGEAGVVGLHGDKGQQGPVGVAGGTGPRGPQGLPGEQGPRGAKGEEGVAGNSGITGDTGPSGPDGARGPQGDKGEKGLAGVVGPRGPKGEQGPKGETGDRGARGPRGDAGTPGPKGPLEEKGCACYELPTLTGNFNDTVSVRLHHSLTLHCDASDPSLPITWRRADWQPIPPSVVVKGNDITFTSASSADKGIYECVATTKTGNITKGVEVQLIEPSRDDCDFESGFCLWRNSVDDRFDWILNKGSTSTALTGPTKDHTRGDTEGYYAYIETSSPRVNNDNARLESPPLSPNKDYCLDFWYHMYGRTLGNLNVKIKRNGLVNTAPLWIRTGPSTDAWKDARISIPPQNTPFSLIIEGVRGDNYYGDIAIDDLTVTEAPCN